MAQARGHLAFCPGLYRVRWVMDGGGLAVQSSEHCSEIATAQKTDNDVAPQMKEGVNAVGQAWPLVLRGVNPVEQNLLALADQFFLLRQVTICVP